MGILLAATIATLASLILIGGVLLWKSPVADRKVLLILIVALLPISPIANSLIRLPLEQCLKSCAIDDGLIRLFSFLFRPALEELVKLWPLLIPFVWRTTTSQTRVWRALAIGLGFGIGEMWMLAEIVFHNEPEIANLGLLPLTGFINERIMVCVIHGALTAVALNQVLTGFPVSVGLHTAGNLPFFLREISAVALTEHLWKVVLQAWVLWYFFAMMVLIFNLAGGDLHAAWLLFGDARCPYCGMVYPRASLSWTLQVVHYDHCPRCKAHNPHERS